MAVIQQLTACAKPRVSFCNLPKTQSTAQHEPTEARLSFRRQFEGFLGAVSVFTSGVTMCLCLTDAGLVLYTSYFPQLCVQEALKHIDSSPHTAHLTNLNIKINKLEYKHTQTLRSCWDTRTQGRADGPSHRVSIVATIVTVLSEPYGLIYGCGPPAAEALSPCHRGRWDCVPI